MYICHSQAGEKKFPGKKNLQNVLALPNGWCVPTNFNIDTVGFIGF